MTNKPGVLRPSPPGTAGCRALPCAAVTGLHMPEVGNGGGDLAETGGGSNSGIIAGGAAALPAVGAAIVVATKRRRTARS
jgi:hypothetical protein